MSDILQVNGQFYIRASASIADSGSRVLKHADTFAVFDRHGDIRPLGFENQGLFHEGTRFLSQWKLALNDHSPLLLSANIKEDNDFLVVDLTNPVLPRNGSEMISHGTIHLVRTVFLWHGNYFERVEVSNFALVPVSLSVQFKFEADYADLFELRGNKRECRGSMQEPHLTSDCVELSYQGLDSVVRRTRIQFGERPQEFSAERAVFKMELQPKQQRCVEVRIACLVGETNGSEDTFDGAFAKVHSAYQDYRKHITHVESSNPQFNDWMNRSRSDLHMLLTRMDEGIYPYAGIPWFSCLFGRDGIITALETLWIFPDIARGVLACLAARQAVEKNDGKDADPGKIIHEERRGEMVALGEVPFGSYYGSIDATLLWVILAGCYYERTADKPFIESLWPHVERALAWADKYGDSDGDEFIEYCQHAGGGLANQGWKDSEDSVFHADGMIPAAPIALCEVQAYLYEARIKAAELADALGKPAVAGEQRRRAEAFKKRFHEVFWCDDIHTYAMALDHDKQPCRVRSSNAGHCLYAGIASPSAADQIKEQLLNDTFFSGWGIRTIPTTEFRYSPMSYHNGSIWPHDNALIAAGLARYGYKTAALRVLSALFDASRFIELNRLPELYCGFRRRRAEGPTLYPVACNPQAWSSAAVFLLIQASLGLRIDAVRKRLYFDNPHLPASVPELEIKNLRVAEGTVDVALIRHEGDVGVNVRRKSGGIDVLVVH